MGRKSKDAVTVSTNIRIIPLAFPEPPKNEPPEEDQAIPGDEILQEETDEDRSGEEDEGEGEAGSASGGGGGVVFEETEHDFDATELQGLSLPIFRNALKKGLKLASRITKQVEPYLRNLLPEVDLRSRVVEVAFSEKGHTTLLLDKGEIVQYQTEKGKLERVRVSPDLDAERAVRYAMAGFIAAGESIDPQHVKFGRSPEFAARMKPIWEREWDKIQHEGRERSLSVGFPRPDVSFADHQQRGSVLSKLPRLGGKTVAKPRIDLPRVGPSRSRDPQL